MGRDISMSSTSPKDRTITEPARNRIDGRPISVANITVKAISKVKVYDFHQNRMWMRAALRL